MKIVCPDCGRAIPAEDIALEAGWAKCRRCQEVVRLADVLPGYGLPAAAGPAKPERPFDAWAVLEREPNKLMVHLPQRGMRASTWGLLFFSLFWTCFVAFWTAGALGVFFNGGQIQWGNLAFAAFSIPFWAVGIGMLGGVLWMARGSRTVYLDDEQMMTELRCLIWRRRRTYPRDEVQHARVGTISVNSRNQDPSTLYPVEIVFTKGSFSLPCGNESEQEWLIAELNDFLQSRPARGG